MKPWQGGAEQAQAMDILVATFDSHAAAYGCDAYARAKKMPIVGRRSAEIQGLTKKVASQGDGFCIYSIGEEYYRNSLVRGSLLEFQLDRAISDA